MHSSAWNTKIWNSLSSQLIMKLSFCKVCKDYKNVNTCDVQTYRKWTKLFGQTINSDRILAVDCLGLNIYWHPREKHLQSLLIVILISTMRQFSLDCLHEWQCTIFPTMTVKHAINFKVNSTEYKEKFYQWRYTVDQRAIIVC